ncbi:glutamate 5-kinase [Caminibacter mediatlanticus TB-2]|uniref:Glutamate 5-kinase n=1 Tax=Caminibacter mediatlanticus TB-2 TaxID=391592 RepID=A0ABX5V9M3_9BACT|nr:glutamate 5-kinase [Caminibacter mediatlanticus]QCT94072.1 glutamate 5-kinase [Caminibacter mediatlanticus TB-2]
MKRIVFKVGTATLYENGKLSDRMDKIVDLLAKLNKEYEILLVSSGAVGAGYTKCPLDKSKLENKQALAAIGQPLLMREYKERFNKYNVVVAQVLVTAADFDSRKRTDNAKKMIEVLLKNKVIPIINENDSVSVEEILFGDNDQLSAYVTYYFDADMLFIISDIDAFYDDNPKVNKNAKPIKLVSEIEDEWLNQKCNPNDKFATGGIVTKLKAAKFLMDNGKCMFLTSGSKLDSIEDFLNGKHTSGTLFCKEKK